MGVLSLPVLRALPDPYHSPALPSRTKVEIPCRFGISELEVQLVDELLGFLVREPGQVICGLVVVSPEEHTIKLKRPDGLKQRQELQQFSGQRRSCLSRRQPCLHCSIVTCIQYDTACPPVSSARSKDHHGDELSDGDDTQCIQ